MTAIPEMTPQPQPIAPHSEAWHEARKQIIGASEVAAIYGLHPYLSPLDLALRKQGKVVEHGETAEQRRGLILEEAVARAYAMKTGAELTPEAFFTNPACPRLGATIDRGIAGAKKHIQIKTHAAFPDVLARYSNFKGADPGPGYPDYELLQVVIEMAVTENDAADLVVFFAESEVLEAMVDLLHDQAVNADYIAAYIAAHDLRIYHIKRDYDLEVTLLADAEKFWRDYVESGNAPTDIRTYRPEGEPRPAAPEEEEALFDLREGWVALQRITAAYEEKRKRVENCIATAAGIASETYGTITWKKSADSVKETTDFEALAKKLLLDFPPEMQAAAIAEFTTAKIAEGSRRFIVPKQWKKLL